MKRTGFTRTLPPRPERQLNRATAAFRTAQPVDASPCPVPKDVRDLAPGDEARLFAHVRSLPCAVCEKEGATQVSHSNALTDGKGRSMKAYPWRIAALCAVCHADIDQGKELSKEARRGLWLDAHHWTLGELFALGLVRPT